MSTEEFIMKLECVRDTLTDNRPLAIATASVHALRCKRIFTDGLNSQGSQIGQYNTTTPLYVNPKKQPRATADSKANVAGLLPPTGKHGDTVFKSTGKPHVTTYVDSYADLRKRIGRSSGSVNLVMWGNLKLNFENNSRGAGPEAIKINSNEYVTGLDAENSKKKSGITQKYGEVFQHTQNEIQIFYEVIAKELVNEISKC